MGYYEDVYLKRLNRFGNDYQSRVRNQRIMMFEDLLTKSIYRVDFAYNGVMEPGLLERYKQDDTQTLQYLLTRIGLNLPGGTILSITDADGRTNKWMVYWLEYIEQSGYNRYVMMKISHTIRWTHELGKQNPSYFTDYGYFFGKQRALLDDKDKGKISTYLENNNEYVLVMPYNSNLKKEDYFEIATGTGTAAITQSYRILNIDCISTQGIQYVVVDPIYQYDKSVTPTRPAGSSDDSYNWLDGDFSGV